VQPQFGFNCPTESGNSRVENAQYQAFIARGYVIVWHDTATGYFVAHAPNVSSAHPYGTPVLTGIPSGSAIATKCG